MNTAANKAYLTILLGLASFFIGSTIISEINKKSRIKNTFNKTVNKTISTTIKLDANFLVIYALCGISFLVLITMSTKSINLMKSGYTLSDIRYTVRYKVFSGGIVELLYTYLARPVTILMMPVSALIFFVSNKRKQKMSIILIAITLLILVVITSGERFILLDFIIYFFVTKLIIGKPKENKGTNKRNKFLIIIIIGVFLMMIFQVTVNRGASMTETLYTYLTGCVPALGIKIEYFDNIQLYTYGLTSIKGFVRMFLVFLNNAGLISSMPKLFLRSEMLTQQIEELIYIGPNIKYNGFVSIFYYFYLDLGLSGVTFFSFIYGVVCTQAYYKMKHNFNIKNCVLYLLLAQSMLTSMFQFEFSNVSFAMSFYYFILFFTKNITSKAHYIFTQFVEARQDSC